MSRYLGMFVALLVPMALFASAAEPVSDDSLRYDSFKIDNVLHRFDRRTGDVEQLAKDPGGGLRWVRVDVQASQPNSRPLGKAAAATEPVRNSEAQTESHLNDTRKPIEQKVIRLWTYEGSEITDVVTDDDRKQSRSAIAEYESKIAMSLVSKIGESITGTIVVKNLGERRLQALEVTMLVPAVGKDTPEAHRFLFLSKQGYKAPPQPAGKALDATAVFESINVPSPSGGAKGSPELKISYLRFDQ